MSFCSPLLMMIQNNPKAITIMINIYGIQKNYKKAVELSLQNK